MMDPLNCNNENQDLGSNEGISCRKIYYENKEICYYSSSNDEDINIINRLSKGFALEKFSSNAYDRKGEYLVFNSNSMELFNFRNNDFTNLTKEEKEIVEKSNTCSYLSYGKSRDSIEKFLDYPLDLDNKEACFQVDQFDELKGLVDCGYAEVTAQNPNNRQKPIIRFTRCFFIPSDNLSSKFLPIYNFYIKTENSNHDKREEALGLLANFDGYYTRRRLEQEEFSYEIIVTSRNGKKVRYRDDKFMEVLEEGKENQNEDGKENKDEKCLQKTINSNYIIILSFLLLLICFYIILLK